MENKAYKIDLIWIGVLFLITIQMIANAVTNFEPLTFNQYGGILLLIIAFFLCYFKRNRQFFAVFIVLLLFSLDVTNNSSLQISGSFGFNVGNDVVTILAINPVGLFLFIIYCVTNRGIFMTAVDVWMRGTPNEQVIEQEKEYTFYYNKFKALSEIEFGRTIKFYNDYPLMAQKAIDDLRKEK